MGNLAGKIFEVQISDGERWTVAGIHQARSAAIAEAEDMLSSRDILAVKVIAESERTGSSDVVFEKSNDKGFSKTITIVPILEASMCSALDDLYGFEARRTVGRLMRHYLDEHGLTVLELVFDSARLKMIERDDVLFPQAVQRVAGIQARALNIKPAARADQLYQLYGQLKDAAVKSAGVSRLHAMLKDRGLRELADHIERSVEENDRERTLSAVLAHHLGEAADWNRKLQALAVFGQEADLGEFAISHLDQVIAEILDGAAALKDLLGGQPDVAAAHRMIILLAAGRCPTPKNAITAIADVNDAIARLDLPLSRRVLYERIAVELGGTGQLTRDDKKAERAAFVGLVRELTETAGLAGGPKVSEAVTRRARMVLSQDVDDLSLDDGLSRVIDLLPHRAARLGFLLDVAVSGLGQRYQQNVQTALARVLEQMTSLASFVPKNCGPEMLQSAIAAIKVRLSAEGLPESWRRAISEALDGVMTKSEKAPDDPFSDVYEVDEETLEMISAPLDKNKIAAGAVIFEEGDPGDIAYLIQSGSVEIVRKLGNGEEILATVGRGEIIGEMALIDRQPRMATARVVEEAELTVISAENMRARLKRLAGSDKVLRRLIDVFVGRLRGEARLAE